LIGINEAAGEFGEPVHRPIVPAQESSVKHHRLVAAGCTALALCLASSAQAEASVEVAKDSQLYRRFGERIDAADLSRIDESLSDGDKPLTDRWRNPADGNVYLLAAAKTFDTAAGPCRAFDLTATIQTHRTTVHGLACRKHGHWRIVE
jgi:hypothetical protein